MDKAGVLKSHAEVGKFQAVISPAQLRAARSHDGGQIRRVAIALSSILLLGNYYYLYLIPFHQGVATGSDNYGIIKLVGIGIFAVSVGRPRLRFRHSSWRIPLLAFILYGCLSMMIKSFAGGSGDILFLNFILASLPFFLADFHDNDMRTFLEVGLFVTALEVLIDIWVAGLGHSLWKDGAFVGGAGNPSSFGLCCNFFIAYVLFYRPRRFSSPLLTAILVLGAIKSNSLLATLTLMLFVTIWIWRRWGVKGVLGLLVLGAAAIYFREVFLPTHLVVKINSLLALTDGGRVGSLSVSYRLLLYKHLWNEMSGYPIFVTLFGYPGYYYYSADSQILTVIGSFGLMGLLLLVAWIVLGIRSCYGRSDGSAFRLMVWVMFVISFFTNRLLDYYPLAIFLFLVISSHSVSDQRMKRGGLTQRTNVDEA